MLISKRARVCTTWRQQLKAAEKDSPVKRGDDWWAREGEGRGDYAAWPTVIKRERAGIWFVHKLQLSKAWQKGDEEEEEEEKRAT